MFGGAIQELLHHAVRDGRGGATGAFCAMVELKFAADEMNRNVLPETFDGEELSINLRGLGGGEPAVAEFLKHREQPFLSCCQRAGLVGIENQLACGLKILPVVEETRP